MSGERPQTGGAAAASEAQADGRAAEREISGNGGQPAGDTLSVTDNRTGATYELAVSDGTLRAVDLRQIKVDEGDFGLMSYDPAYMNTASCRSAITYIDGDAGILQHRGYPIEQLCEHSSYLEVAYLLIKGELPARAQLEQWVHDITIHTFVHENIKDFMQGFRYDANPMGMLVASVGRSRPSTRTPTRSTTRRSAKSRSSACSPRCPRSQPSPSGTTWASPTSIRTTTSATRATSSR